MSTAVVAGGGISGIVSALVLKKKFEKVVLVEKNPEFGGLLRSRVNEQGFWFDYGCHFLRDTGVPAVDDLIYSEIRNSSDWLKLDNLRAGSFLNGKLNEESQFLDARSLSRNQYYQGIMQCLEISSSSSKAKNLEEELAGKFGSVLTQQLFEPVVRKFFHEPLDNLSPGANSLFFPQRILAFTPDSARLLKQVALYDEKFGFHSYLEGVSDLKNYYPKQGGVGQWISLLEEKMSGMGIVFVKGHGIDELSIKESSVVQVKLDNNELVQCDKLVWTLPPILFLRSIQKKVELEQPPKRLTSTILNYVVDKNPNTKVHFLTCHDPIFNTFRITFYPSIQGEFDIDSYRFTVECISLNTLDSALYRDKVLEELKEMSLFPKDTKIKFCEVISMPSTFPVPTLNFEKQSQMLLNKCQDLADNVLFLGRNSSKKWFMNEILVDSYENTAKFALK